MKKLFILCLIIALPLLIGGCGKKSEVGLGGAVDTAKNIQKMNEIGSAAQKAQESGNPEDMAKAVEKYGELAAQLELSQFDKSEAVDAPAGFPKELIYQSGKLLESSDSSDDTYIDEDITIKSTDEPAKIKEYYKNLLSSGDWKLTDQSSASDSADYTAKNSATGLQAQVNISYNQLSSKLVEIKIYYSGDKVQR